MAIAVNAATAAMTAASIRTMNQAARLSVCGEGFVMPMVLMKAFAMSCRRFICFLMLRQREGSRGGAVSNRMPRRCILMKMTCCDDGGRIHLKRV